MGWSLAGWPRAGAAVGKKQEGRKKGQRSGGSGSGASGLEWGKQEEEGGSPAEAAEAERQRRGHSGVTGGRGGWRSGLGGRSVETEAQCLLALALLCGAEAGWGGGSPSRAQCLTAQQ